MTTNTNRTVAVSLLAAASVFTVPLFILTAPHANAAMLMQAEKRAHDIVLKYLQGSAEGNLMEIKAGNLAKEKGQTQEVKDYGAMLVTDHTANLEKLRTLATALKVTLKEELTDKQKEMCMKMESMDSSSFDAKFINHMITDHENDIAKSQEAAKFGDEAATKKYAEDNIVVFTEHLNKAKEIKKAHNY